MGRASRCTQLGRVSGQHSDYREVRAYSSRTEDGRHGGAPESLTVLKPRTLLDAEGMLARMLFWACTQRAIAMAAKAVGCGALVQCFEKRGCAKGGQRRSFFRVSGTAETPGGRFALSRAQGDLQQEHAGKQQRGVRVMLA